MPADTTPDDSARTDPASWLDRYGDVLYRHALLRVRRQEVAEDLVQETLIAALGAREQFEGKSSEQTWLISILSRKIVDHFRKAGRSRLEDVDSMSGPEFFATNGHWNGKVRAWRCDPQEVLECKEFWQVVGACLSDLPAIVADAFVMKVLDEMERTEVCDQLQISPSNLSVRLHRARLLLQQCLQRNWFSPNE